MDVVKRLASFIETINKYTYNDTLTMTTACSLHTDQLFFMLTVSYINHTSFKVNNEGNEGNHTVLQSFVNTSDITLQSFLSVI